MRRVGFVLSVVLAWALVGGLGGSVGASGGAYHAWVACSLNKQAAPSHSCGRSSAKGAFFKSVDAAVHYKVCVKYPSGTRLCAAHQSAPKGKVRLNTITSTQLGQHRVTWSVGGKQVAAWTFDVKA